MGEHLIKRIRDLFYDRGMDDGVILVDNLAEDLGLQDMLSKYIETEDEENEPN